jgi:2-polyprenyl-3-methyl-5-hydroxy-6-metoxy-1,4-benzoquinol methylase
LEHVERIEPEQSQWRQHIGDHLNRYRFGSKFVAGRRVLDAGCGIGYGTRVLLDGGASEVVGVDISEKAIATAKQQFADARVRFACEDCEKLETIEGSFDVIVAFESLEHFHDVNAFLDQVVRLLSPGGIFICSTPNALITGSDKNGHPANPFHVQEYTPADFRSLLDQYFANVQLTGQHPTAAMMLRNRINMLWCNPFIRLGWLIQRARGQHIPWTLPESIATEGDYVISEGNLNEAVVLLAICRRAASQKRNTSGGL